MHAADVFASLPLTLCMQQASSLGLRSRHGAQASIGHLEERCNELKAASTVHESRAHTLEGEGLSSAQIVDHLQVQALPSHHHHHPSSSPPMITSA